MWWQDIRWGNPTILSAKRAQKSSLRFGTDSFTSLGLTKREATEAWKSLKHDLGMKFPNLSFTLVSGGGDEFPSNIEKWLYNWFDKNINEDFYPSKRSPRLPSGPSRLKGETVQKFKVGDHVMIGKHPDLVGRISRVSWDPEATSQGQLGAWEYGYVNDKSGFESYWYDESNIQEI